jgi:putative peptidoglycan lipid II flippase
MNLVTVPWLGHAGLALSIGLAALINAAWLLIGLRRSGAYRPEPGWAGLAVRVVVATALLGAALAAAAHWVDWIGLQHAPWLRAGWLGLSLAGAALLYFSTLALGGIRIGQFAQRG